MKASNTFGKILCWKSRNCCLSKNGGRKSFQKLYFSLEGLGVMLKKKLARLAKSAMWVSLWIKRPMHVNPNQTGGTSKSPPPSWTWIKRVMLVNPNQTGGTLEVPPTLPDNSSTERPIKISEYHVQNYFKLDVVESFYIILHFATTSD